MDCPINSQSEVLAMSTKYILSTEKYIELLQILLSTPSANFPDPPNVRYNITEHLDHLQLPLPHI